MSRTAQLFTGVAFVLFLTGLGLTDAFFTRDINRLPTISSDVTKQDGPDIRATLAKLQIVPEQTTEPNLISRVIPTDVPIETFALLQKNDRIGFIAIAQSPDVKTFFISFKQALNPTFSLQLKDLKDVTETPAGKPTRNILSFFDPGAYPPDRLIFLRVRQRLYEFHVTAGKEDLMNGLVEALSD